MARKPKAEASVDPATKAFQEGWKIAWGHPLLGSLAAEVSVNRSPGNRCPGQGWGVVTEGGTLHLHPTRRAEPEEWAYVVAHLLLHLGFGHFRQRERQEEWLAACDVFVARFLEDIRVGRRPHAAYVELPAGSDEGLYRRFCAEGVPAELRELSVAGPGSADMLFGQIEQSFYGWRGKPNWTALFSNGIQYAVSEAVEKAAGPAARGEERPNSDAQRAKAWFISSYPLLGALASTFKVVEDPEVCRRHDIAVAAVNAEAGEIFMNPAAALSPQECRFVMAHELLHVGLRHAERCQGRDFYFWNVACDFVINGWLIEMGLGELPQVGGLYDPELKGLSAEAVYDRIVTDLRKFRKLATLRGVGMCDILTGSSPRAHGRQSAADLDAFYRSLLAQGLALCERTGRGYLPADLVEEIRALSMPPIPWEVQLAQWFDGFFAPPETRRTYARLSRRQSATPNIPRPRVTKMEGTEDGRTFGVVLDTSGSMDRQLLGKALGAVASYAMSREVPLVRLVFCDAAAYDEGYVAAEAIAERVRVRGRGGTVLQPGVDLLEEADDFPKEGPILVITDAQCDRVRLRREHAFLTPKNARLPFVPRGPVFRMD